MEDMPISEVGATSSGNGSAGTGGEVLPLRTGPTEIDRREIPVATLVIRVRDQTGEETYFKVNRTTRMEKVINTFAARKGLPANTLRLLFNGTRVHAYETPAMLELEDQDQLDCMLEQPWTGPWTSFTRACVGHLCDQQAQAGQRDEEASRAAAAGPAGRVEEREGLTQRESELRREALEESIKISTCVQTALEELRKRTVDLEQAQSKLERRTLLVTLVSLLMFPLAMWVAAATRA